nr:MAG TPA: hypothetical protein [Caudoviricetes sp.]
MLVKTFQPVEMMDKLDLLFYQYGMRANIDMHIINGKVSVNVVGIPFYEKESWDRTVREIIQEVITELAQDNAKTCFEYI